MSNILFNNKRILVVCKETFSYPLFFLVQKWIKNNVVGAFFFNPPETHYSRCALNDITYFAFKSIDGIILYDSNQAADEFTKILESNEIVDPLYLEIIENKYTHYQNINNQIMSSQFLTRHYHYRNYMHSVSYAQQLNWLIFNYKNIEQILDNFKPDVVLDIDTAELARTALCEVCNYRKIPYVSIDFPRFEMFKLYTYNLCKCYTDSFYKSYQLYKNGRDEELIEESNYINDFRQKEQIMNSMFRGDVTAQYEPTPIIQTLKRLYYICVHFWRQEHAGINKELKRSNYLLYPNSFEYVKFYFRHALRKQKLMQKNKYFEAPENVKYVYMPLHLIPESSTFTVSPMYVNELTIIEAVSKSLPAGWWLYVKEHQAMVGERGVDFYERANQLPNVKMVQLNYYRDPKPWIINSQGVVTISGTSAYEAALLGKHSIIFSDVPFSLIDGIDRLRSFEDLPAALAKFTEPVNNIKSCAAYIKAVKDNGKEINLKLLLNKGERILRGEEVIDDEYQNNLDNLEELMYKGYNDYMK